MVAEGKAVSCPDAQACGLVRDSWVRIPPHHLPRRDLPHIYFIYMKKVTKKPVKKVVKKVVKAVKKVAKKSLKKGKK